jgi:SH3-like domain-containing protein
MFTQVWMRIMPVAVSPHFGRHKHLAITSVLLVTAGLVVWAAAGQSKTGNAASGETTASISTAPVQLGPSGLPLPRFVTLKAGKVNVRKGPSSDHDVAWVYQRKGLPVEITAESDNWRKIRDEDGSEGWILQSMLSGKRSVVMAAWAKDKGVMLRDDATAKAGFVARLDAGVMGEIGSCDGDWCEVTAGDYQGYAQQAELWGVYPGEKVD